MNEFNIDSVVRDLQIEHLIGYQKADDYIQIVTDKENIQFDFYKPYPVFQEFHQLGAIPEVRVRFLMAANRIGKSVSCFAETAMHATLTYPDWWEGYRYTSKDMVIWVGGRSVKEDLPRLRRGFFDGQKGFPPFIHSSLIIKETEKEITLRNARGGQTILTFKSCHGGVDKQNSQSGWTGENVSFIWIDEPPPMSVLNEANTRITRTAEGDKSMMIISSTCVELSEFFLYVTERVEEEEVDIDGVKLFQSKQYAVAPKEVVAGNVYITASLDDAPHLTTEEKERMIASWPVNERQARSTGIPILGSGLVFPILEKALTYEPFAIPEHYARIGGMDFGWNDPTVLLLGALDRDRGVLYIFFEYAASQKTPDQHIFNISSMKAADCFKWCPVFGDTSANAKTPIDGSRLIDLYKNARIDMRPPDKKDKNARALKCLQMMMDGKLKVSSQCRGLLNEIRTYSYKGVALQDGNDHHIDALLYLLSGLSSAKTHTNFYAKNMIPLHYGESDSGGSWMRV